MFRTRTEFEHVLCLGLRRERFLFHTNTDQSFISQGPFENQRNLRGKYTIASQ